MGPAGAAAHGGHAQQTRDARTQGPGFGLHRRRGEQSVVYTRKGSSRQLTLFTYAGKTLSTVMCHYGKRLQSCQAHLNDSTQLLQVNAPCDHARPAMLSETSSSVSGLSTGADLEPHSHQQPHEQELQQRRVSVARAAAPGQHRAGEWQHLHCGNKTSRAETPLYLQFDKVQESFLSLEQQISTFQAHLEGLGKASRDGPAGKLAHTKTTHVASSKTGDAPVEARNSNAASACVSAADADTDAPRSALPFPSTIRRLHRSQRKK